MKTVLKFILVIILPLGLAALLMWVTYLFEEPFYAYGLEAENFAGTLLYLAPIVLFICFVVVSYRVTYSYAKKLRIASGVSQAQNNQNQPQPK